MRVKTFMAALAACAGMAALGDVITFKSGAKLIGTVERIDGDVIKFKSDDVGAVDVKQSLVAEMTTDKENRIVYKDAREEQAVVALSNGVYTASSRPFDMNDVKGVNPPSETWHGSVNASATAARGNTMSEKVAILADMNRRWEKDRFVANGGYYFGQSGTTHDNKRKDEDRIMLSAQEDHFWSTRVYCYVNGKFERDRMLDLDRRFRLGTGLGYQWLDGENFESTGKWSFNQEAGAEYVNERWSERDDPDEAYAAVRYAHHLHWFPIWASSTDVFHNFEYHPSVDDWSEIYVFNADLGFSTPIWASWNLLGKMEWDYNSAPSGSAKRSDLRYILGLGYKW